jgi:hypothetical protein
MTQEATLEYWNYLSGIDAVTFEGDTEAGRTVRVEVPWSIIEKIAEWGTKTKDSNHRGHMFWHMQNPDREFPCEMCKED